MPFKQDIRLLGVSVSELSVNTKQSDLFEDGQKREKLTETIDMINKKYGNYLKTHISSYADKFENGKSRISRILVLRRGRKKRGMNRL